MVDDAIKRGDYLITIESSKSGHVAWISRADGGMVWKNDGSAGRKIGTHTYAERDHAIQAAEKALDDREVS